MPFAPATALAEAAAKTGSAVTPRRPWTVAEEMEHDMDEGSIFAHRAIAAILKRAQAEIAEEVRTAWLAYPSEIVKFDVFTSLCDALDGLGEINSAYLAAAGKEGVR